MQAAFRALVGKGYQTLQNLLLELCQWQPTEGLLNALLDMLVDGKFDIKAIPVIKVTLIANLLSSFVSSTSVFFLFGLLISGILISFRLAGYALIMVLILYFSSCFDAE